ncbi:hypothetical protein JCM3775_006911 [Rhodotorula graminis]|uniref:DUF1279 domain-containing protein n=1 Tax=Rhodotorula graminis (strain WP1) TaxID=578459 RepID=A0A194SAY5_RHOGW|nr:uncharacterized protein RHOBADRAFT_41752 [Rhodotorula graminis WP1]KPV77754.1 hypothetical protein RHOBADRAFT_41752 [Rhodotorula graminis WP1]
MQRTPALRTALKRSLASPSSSSPARLVASHSLVIARTSPSPAAATAAARQLAPLDWRLVTRAFATHPASSASAPLGTAPSPSSHQHQHSQSNSNSSSSSSSTEPNDPDDSSKVPLTQRIKYLFRKHGWTALVVYLVLSAADFAACFLVISAIGADRVREAEDWVLGHLGWRRQSDDGSEPAGKWRRAVDGFRERRAAQAAIHPKGQDAHPSPAAAQAVSEGATQGEVREAERKGRSAASTYATTAVLAYAVHKTLLLPFRVGVTVAVTPRVVRTLQSWGWKVGMAAGAPPTAKAAAAAAGKAAAP